MTTNRTRATTLKEIEALAKKAFSGDELKLFQSFADGFYFESTPDDLINDDINKLFAIAQEHFTAFKKRKPGKAYVQLLNMRSKVADWKGDCTTIQIINDDMPFLVDSITGALAVSLRSRIYMMHHPILSVERDDKGNLLSIGGKNGKNESLIYVEIDSQSDAKVLKTIQTTLEEVLADVRLSVSDWKGMLAKIDETVASLTVNPPPLDQDDVDETIRFLRWLGADHFTFLGFREYTFEDDKGEFTFSQVKGSGLGILRDKDRNVLRDKDGLTPMSPEIMHFLKQPEPVIITKANVKSTVHRVSHLDYIGVKIFDADGKAVGERRFIGLFTSLAYSKFAHEVPLLRKKVEAVNKRALFQDRTYARKALNHILETFPRDELFQISEDRMYNTAMGVIQLLERPRPKAFIRPDRFERFVSALVYVPRETYNSGLRIAVEEILCAAFNGEVSVYYAKLEDNPLARWHFIIRTKPGEVPKVDPREINEKIAEAALGWSDRLRQNLVERNGEEVGNRLNFEYKDRFTAAYREAFTPAQAAYDIAKLEELEGTDEMRVDFYRHLADGPDRYRLKIHHSQHMIPLSVCMPVLENLGFMVLGEHSYEMADKSGAHIHDFTLHRADGIEFEFEVLKPLVEDLAQRVWDGFLENDSFNELVIKSAMTWNEILVLRAYGKYLRQLGMGYTPDYIADCMVDNSDLASLLVKLFKVQFDPAYKGKSRDADAAAIEKDIIAALESVKSLDQDRILRAYIDVIKATQRTNYYQEGVLEDVDERALGFKIRSTLVEEAPLPRPYAEIWVYSPQVEGVHLRGGPVARGGLRWSDRREDFRTEVLGLVKAQQVKNAVIVPQGAKGGFYPKNLPPISDREAFMAEGIACYRSFITTLLSLTDNIKAGKIVPPKGVLRRDGDDPYLVVAADKGTATFSDIANGISQDHGFWLDDAFASGGSQGYDHKKMGITARGAWVSVQRHFRELGINTQTDPFTVVGVGDMSGDVFGNGMLLSKTIALKAAFNHLHIFIDPNPGDLDAAWAERKRLFDTPRTGWDDYDTKLISKGGGVFSRADKSIKLSKEIQEWLGVTKEQMTPTELINAILRAEADLLWFGGIGTYVRSSEETDAQVGDRANDAIRVTGSQLRYRVVGEGGNLGMTQRGRIEYCRKGGRANTDFIDNSAGVDCSDKEVNIKILLADIMSKKKLNREDRNTLLVKMTDQVGDIVLSDNYLQTQAISLAERQANSARENHLGLIRALERDGNLNREIENLPSDEGFSELAANDKGLSRPEISILMAYAKMSLQTILERSQLIDDDVLRPELEWGFPTDLREAYADGIGDHQLRREIISTVLANEVVNWGGLTFVYEVKEETGLGVEDIVAAFVAVREIYSLQDRWDAINDLDYKVSSDVQYEMHQSLSASLKSQVLWVLRNLPHPFKISEVVAKYKPSVNELFNISADILSGPVQKAFVARRDFFKKKSVPHALATFVAGFEVLRSGADIISVADQTQKSVDYAAEVYFSLGDAIGFDWLIQRSDRIAADDHWDGLAIRSVVEDLADQQRALVMEVCQNAGKKTAEDATGTWLKQEQTRIIRASRLVDDLNASGTLTVAKLSFAARHLRSILR
ncbi:glutamate dehydrogenase [Kordiimonas sediminis]|uniref:Glutamate dehydrogenase n=1 Tax=Kordiimonas sediminis TaxID=1735581 RepID=A0A919ALT8_9PROT|nr:NAD-glutamate dehydrogenase [Kordiimonas sediminis]GHF15066.1 glutamate dehydrogenase [Kordiimonas sediminis]